MPDYVSIIAVTEGQDILLVRQYRPVVESYTLEVPSGHVDPGESPADAAKRELLEETGYRAENVELLGNFLPDSGRLENEMWCYYASGVVRTTSVTEIGIEVILHDYKNIMKLVAEGKIQNALHVGAILLAKLKSDPG
ncbi:MAG: NUDIX hydrolase [Xenococcaceae cyanobacterium]